MLHRIVHTLLLLSALATSALFLAGCPGPGEEVACDDEPCGPLMVCDPELKRCAAPADVSPALVTRGPSLVVSDEGAIYVAAYVSGTKDLAFGVWDELEGAFRYQLVDEKGDVGRYAALALFTDGRPAIAYNDATELRLKFATLRDDGTWRVEVVDETASVGTDVDLAIDTTDVAHVSYRDYTYDALRYAWRVNNAWQISFVDSGVDEVSGIPEAEACPAEQRQRVGRGVGFDTHIVLQGSTPVISYYDADCGTLRLARGSGTSFALRVVDGWDPDTYEGPTRAPVTSVGRFSDVAVDPLGQLVVAYFDTSLGVLKVARSPAGVPMIDIADDGRREVVDEAPAKHIVGQMPSIAFDANGAAVISHLDAETREVLVTTDATGVWSTQAIAGPPQGFETDLVVGRDGTRYVVGVSRSLSDALPVGLLRVTP